MLSMFVAMRRKSRIFPAKFAENNNRIIRTITEWLLLSKKKSVSFTLFLFLCTIIPIILRYLIKFNHNMSYAQLAQLELLNALKNINSEAELNEFKDLVAHFFAAKAQKEIDALWDNGTINEETIKQWGEEHMRTPYRYASNRT